MAKRAGKYDHLIDELPTVFGEKPDKQVKVNVVKDEIRREAEQETALLTPGGLVKRYIEARAKKDAMKAALKRHEVEIAAYEQLMYAVFEQQEMKRFVANNGAAVGIYKEPNAKVIDREAFRLWCIGNGYETALQLPWPKTNSITKERLLEGEEEPDGVVATALVKVRLTGADGKAIESDDEDDE